jgi:hypothetical protein
MNMIKTIAAVAVSLACAGSAFAATLSLSNVQGVWSDVAGPATQLNGVGTSEIKWGTPFGAGNTVQSGYSFTGIDGSGIAPDTDFEFGRFVHNNFVINAGTSITGAKLTISVDVSFDGSPSQTVVQVFDFAHLETPNNANPCADGGANGSGVNVNGCADRVTATLNAGASQEFQIGNQIFTLTLSGFLVGGQPLDNFWTVEQQSNPAILIASYSVRDVDPAPVPLPASAILLAAVVAGLGAASHLRRKA